MSQTEIKLSMLSQEVENQTQEVDRILNVYENLVSIKITLMTWLYIFFNNFIFPPFSYVILMLILIYSI